METIFVGDVWLRLREKFFNPCWTFKFFHKSISMSEKNSNLDSQTEARLRKEFRSEHHLNDDPFNQHKIFPDKIQTTASTSSGQT